MINGTIAKQILDRLHKDYLYWEGMFKDIKTFTKECQVCIRRNNYRKPKEAKIQFFPTNKFGEIISVDYMGPLPTTSKNNKYILTIIDKWTRYARIIPLPSASYETTIKAILSNWIYDFGIFKRLLSDNGTHFVNILVQRFLTSLNIAHHISTAYHPQTNGQSERLHRVINDKLKVLKLEELTRDTDNPYKNVEENWDECLKAIEFHWNSSVHTVTGYSPHELVFGRKISTNGFDLFRAVNEIRRKISDGNFREYMKAQYKILRQYRRKARSNQKKYYEKKSKYFNKDRITRKLKVGQQVYLWENRKRLGKITGNIGRFTAPYDGPFIVVKRFNKVNYLIQDPISKQIYREHINNIKN